MCTIAVPFCSWFVQLPDAMLLWDVCFGIRMSHCMSVEDTMDMHEGGRDRVSAFCPFRVG